MEPKAVAPGGSGGLTDGDALQALPRGRRHGGPAAQRRLLPRLLPPLRRPAGHPGHRQVPDGRPHRPAAGRGLGRQGLPGPLGPAAGARLPGRRPLPEPWHRRLLRALQGRLPGVRGRAGRLPAGPRPGRRARLHDPGGGRQGRPLLLRGVRAVQALRVQPGRPRRRLRRGLHRPQPRRRGRGAVRQHPALGHRGHGPPVPGPGGDPPRPGQEGQAAVPGGRARDRRLLRAQGHRLRGRGVPPGRREHPDAAQGDPQPDGGGGPRHQAQLPVRLPGPGRRPAQGGRRRRADRVRPLRHDHPGPRGPRRRGGLRLLPLQGPPGQAPPGGRGRG